MSIGMSSVDGGLQVKVGTLFGRELILITERQMEVQTRFLFFVVARRLFDNTHVRQLRYEEWTEKGVRTCGIRFKYNGKTQVLVKALMGESDTLRTVVRIINVYKFSHWLAPGQEQLTNSA
jgi:hypothetical protein